MKEEYINAIKLASECVLGDMGIEIPVTFDKYFNEFAKNEKLDTFFLKTSRLLVTLTKKSEAEFLWYHKLQEIDIHLFEEIIYEKQVEKLFTHFQHTLNKSSDQGPLSNPPQPQPTFLNAIKVASECVLANMEIEIPSNFDKYFDRFPKNEKLYTVFFETTSFLKELTRNDKVYSFLYRELQNTDRGLFEKMIYEKYAEKHAEKLFAHLRSKEYDQAKKHDPAKVYDQDPLFKACKHTVGDLNPNHNSEFRNKYFSYYSQYEKDNNLPILMQRLDALNRTIIIKKHSRFNEALYGFKENLGRLNIGGQLATEALSEGLKLPSETAPLPAGMEPLPTPNIANPPQPQAPQPQAPQPQAPQWPPISNQEIQSLCTEVKSYFERNRISGIDPNRIPTNDPEKLFYFCFGQGIQVPYIYSINDESLKQKLTKIFKDQIIEKRLFVAKKLGLATDPNKGSSPSSPPLGPGL